MGWCKLLAMVMLASCLTARAGVAHATDGPFEPDLLRLSEVLGSLHFLRNLCGEKGDTWRVEMEKLLATENPEPERREKFVARFNRGYRAFENTYTTCTGSAIEAISRYMKEGEGLSREIATRYGN